MNNRADADANEHIGRHLFGRRYHLLPGGLYSVLKMKFLLGHIYGVAVSDKFLHLFL